MCNSGITAEISYKTRLRKFSTPKGNQRPCSCINKCSLTSRTANSELASIVSSDVTILPDVQVILLGRVLGLDVAVDDLGQPPASFAVDHHQAVSHEVLADVLVVGGVKKRHVGEAANAVLHVDLDFAAEHVLFESIEAGSGVILLKSSDFKAFPMKIMIRHYSHQQQAS